MDELLNRSTPAREPGSTSDSAPPSSDSGARPCTAGDPGGQVIEHEPEAIQKLGENIEEQVGKLIEQARSALEEAKISEDAFSTSGWVLAAAYPGAHEFFVMDAESKHKHMDTVKSKLANTAKHWREAEQKSTVRT